MKEFAAGEPPVGRGFPTLLHCDLKHEHCAQLLPDDPNSNVPNAYVAEQHLGNILRYLKCCILDLNGTSRIYGGYAVNPPPGEGDDTAGCLNPEPFAYEEGFAVQRLIVAQIDRTTMDYAGDVRLPESAPWVDWGPYLWADGVTPSSGSGLNWCDSTTKLDPHCIGNPGDFRFGDLDDGFTQFWGDHTHPTYKAAEKVANRLVKFIQGSLGGPQQSISNWVTPWVQK